VVDLLVAAGLAKSKGEARRLIEGGGISIGAEKVTAIDAVMSAPGLLRAGKKRAVSVLAAEA
jgi:tyrosyl-tRNA synthetase